MSIKNGRLVFPTINPNEIDVKIKQVGEKGSVALLYKDARVDMRMLDEEVGAMNWRSSYREVKGNLYCEISIYDPEKNQWVSKEDCGVESRSDEDGNEKKGEASDSFKRAGFKWGIGRELYNSPFVFFRADKVPTTKDNNGKWKLTNPFTKFSVSDATFDENRNFTKLVIIDDKGEVVYSFGKTPNIDFASTFYKEEKITDKQISEINGEIAQLSSEKQEAFNKWLLGTFKTSDLRLLSSAKGEIVLVALKKSLDNASGGKK